MMILSPLPLLIMKMTYHLSLLPLSSSKNRSVTNGRFFSSFACGGGPDYPSYDDSIPPPPPDYEDDLSFVPPPPIIIEE